MRNLSMLTLTPILSIFCLVFLFYHITLASFTAPQYVPVDDITLDCGSATSNISKDMDGRDWSGDFQSKFFPKDEHNLKSNTSHAPKEGTITKAPYTTAPIYYSQFTYVFPLPAGPKFVRLHFNPVYYYGFEGYKAFFTVKAGSFTLLRNFTTAVILADSLQNLIVKEFCINVAANQKLNLTFIPFSTTLINFYAFINGIEIVSIPENLYYSPKGAPINPLYVGQSPTFYISNNMALEMAYRLNVGGNLISPTEDTGLFRKWSLDIKYFKNSGLTIHNASFIPNYSKIANYTTPDDVCRSGRTMGLDSNKNKISNLTWELPVDSGFHYLDYVVKIQKKGVEDNNHVLSIDLHPDTGATSDDAILNGVEVFKLSNSDGNLAGPSQMLPSLPAASTTKESKTKKTVFIAIGSGMGILVVLTLACCMVLLKLRKSGHYVYYYRLSKCCCWHDPYKGKSTRKKASSLPKELCRRFSINQIKIATDNFHQELIIGRGGFGYVYKGFIDESMIVAIKCLNPKSR
nr:putative receptor-like protein kinase [Quercus suber]